ncbi:hypothetical protein B0T13DRAFT_307476 [Neurospora crassa]|nr:hypothetical protein B0T13DRAFT_307476 [Neurospora crassa]
MRMVFLVVNVSYDPEFSRFRSGVCGLEGGALSLRICLGQWFLCVPLMPFLIPSLPTCAIRSFRPEESQARPVPERKHPVPAAVCLSVCVFAVPPSPSERTTRWDESGTCQARGVQVACEVLPLILSQPCTTSLQPLIPPARHWISESGR